MIEKTVFTSNGDSFRISVPLAKIDKERRIVSGFASLDNIDQHDDIVPIDAATKAFGTFRGNLREMHQPVAVGKVVSFSQEPYYDAESDKTYQGVFVKSYISLGAEDTWQKVLDGTLTGFSIGGVIKDSDTEFNPDVQKSIRTIKDLELHELSLVDNPANQFANVLSIQKGADGLELTGSAVDIKLDNVFWCPEDRAAVMTSDETRKCAICESDMENIGWIEHNDPNTTIGDVVNKFLGSRGTEEVTKPDSEEVATPSETDGRGGVEKLATEETVEPVEETVETVETVEEVAEVVETPAADETVEEVSEVETKDEFDLAKAFESFSTAVTETLTGFSKKIDALETAVAGVEDLAKTTKEISESLEGVKESVTKEIGEVKASTDRLEKATAVKKSGDLEGGSTEETIKKSEWNGTFVSTESLVSN